MQNFEGVGDTLKAFLVAVIWRLGIGIGIALCGILISALTGRWNIEYWWFGGFGILMLLLAVLPFSGGRTSSAEMAWMKPEAFVNEYRQTRNTFSGSMNWTITTFLIGLINLVASIIVFHVHG